MQIMLQERRMSSKVEPQIIDDIRIFSPEGKNVRGFLLNFPN